MRNALFRHASFQERSVSRDPDHRFRFPVQPAHRPARPGASGLLPDRTAGDRPRKDPGPPARGDHPLRRARLHLRGAFAAGGQGDLRSRDPDPGDLLRPAVHGRRPGGRGHPVGKAGIRFRRADRREGGGDLRRRGEEDALLDEPRRPDRPPAGGFPDHRLHGEYRGGRRRGREAPVLRPPVPSGGGPHGRREKDAGEFPLRRLPLREELDDEILRPGRRRGDPGDGRRQTGDPRAFAGGSIPPLRPSCSTGPSAASSPASSWTTACCGWARRRRSGPSSRSISR